MTRRGGPKTQVDPAVLVEYLDKRSSYVTGGTPKRRRLTINCIPVSETDARMIRRWRAGKIQGVTQKSADALLARYNLIKKETA
jgi:hypothetical protein